MVRSITILTLLALAASSGSAARGDQIAWLSSIDQARQIAGGTNRLVLVHFWSTSCLPCLRLEQSVFNQPGIAGRLNVQYVPVKVNIDQFPTVALQYGVTAWPTDVILAPNGRVVATLRCPPDQFQYLGQLDRVAQAVHLGVNGAYAGVSGQGNPPLGPGAPGMAVAPVAPGSAAGAPPANVLRPTGGNNEDRYAEYFRNGDPSTPAGGGGTMAAAPQYRQSPPAPPAAAAGAPGPSAAALAPRSAAPGGLAALHGPPAAPLALNGYCPVELVEHERGVKGDVRYGVVHRGRTYLFSGPAQQQKFLAHPDDYSPALSGYDPVLACDGRQWVFGNCKTGVFYNKRIYLFSSAATLAQFSKDPSHYAEQIRMAETPGTPPLR